MLVLLERDQWGVEAGPKFSVASVMVILNQAEPLQPLANRSLNT